MKIKEILDAIKQGKTLAEIGKDIGVGKEKLSASLKNAGYSFNRKDGWFFSGQGEQPVDKDYTEFIKGVKKANVSTKEPKNQRSNKDSNIPAKEEIKQANEQVAPTLETTKERSNVVRKRSSFDLDVELMKELKIQAVIHDKNIYEMVETAIRQYLKDLN
ncbi:TPA: hypothetical protein VPA43_001798 [Streptococcus pyogenes]|uniref:hypothetical protein n=1 Tax=Priestia megaterium TaxID=1404 RepID=UPI001E573D9B|nr:hypothetical protein [Priestia megaterium]MCE4093356.1 hypothetical protein [Priestia megaterium]HES8073955.1 hypothetical protein [Streptococcus pyogenes]